MYKLGNACSILSYTGKKAYGKTIVFCCMPFKIAPKYRTIKTFKIKKYMCNYTKYAKNRKKAHKNYDFLSLYIYRGENNNNKLILKNAHNTNQN